MSKTDDYWHGAIDAFVSEGHSAAEVCKMIMEMGCPPDTAVGLTGIEESELD